MQNSKSLAGLIGPTFMALGAMVLMDQGLIVDLVHDTTEGPMLVVISGMLVFVAGLAIVRAHNSWAKGWPVIVTIVGWFGILGGLARMLFPGLILQTAGHFIQVPYVLVLAGVFILAVGAFLSFKAYSRG